MFSEISEIEEIDTDDVPSTRSEQV